MSDASVSVNEASIVNAYSFINSLNANGGTRALEPLKYAMMMNSVECTCATIYT